MADVNELIKVIVSKFPEISKDTILKKIEDEREKSGGLISDDVLFRMVAAEFGVEISGKASVPTPTIESLVPGLSDVSIVGRIIAVYPAKILEKNKRLKFASILIADKSGVMRIVLWNDKAELLEFQKIEVGQVVRFSHGYTKESRWGNVELHLAEKGEIEILSENLDGENYPTIAELSTKIRAVNSALKNRRLNIVGKVKQIVQESTFERKDLKVGKVMRLVLMDETGEISLVVWNDKVNEVKQVLEKSTIMQIVNAKVKKTINGKMEIHADHETYIDVFKPGKFLKIAELKEGLKNVNVEGEVVTKPILRIVKTSKGETVKLAVFEIKDESGRIWVSAWRKNAEKTLNLKTGEKVAFQNVSVKKGFGDQLEISTRNTTTIEIMSRETDLC